jgi:hypothetical protein
LFHHYWTTNYFKQIFHKIIEDDVDDIDDVDDVDDVGDVDDKQEITS